LARAVANDESERKDRLANILGGVDERARELEKMGRTLSQEARRAMDTASFERNILTNIPNDKSLPPETWDRSEFIWKEWGQHADNVLNINPDVIAFSAVTASSTAAVSLSVVGIMSMCDLNATQRDAIQLQSIRYHQTIDRPAIVEDVRGSMRRLGLDIRSLTHQSALVILENSVAALDRPVSGDGGPVSILVTLRECIDAVITELIRRRPKQEVAKSFDDKIMSLGKQCGRPLLSNDHFVSLAFDGKKLTDVLSGGKQRALTRDQLIEFFNDGLMYLRGLLLSIDETRLRTP